MGNKSTLNASSPTDTSVRNSLVPFIEKYAREHPKKRVSETQDGGNFPPLFAGQVCPVGYLR